MEDFRFYNPTRIYFGNDSLDNLTDELKKDYERILIVYGRESIKKNGLYDKVINILSNLKKTVFELSGVMPNPRLDKVYEGIEICKKENIDFILAIGGGSVIDCAKAISVGAKTDKDVWDEYYVNKRECGDTLPIGSILTLAATGSEMNNDSVITNWNSHTKLNYTNDKTYPKFSILNPTYTCTVSKNQTVYGSIDILIHAFEQYFSYPRELCLSDCIAEALIKFVIKNIRKVVEKLDDYDARSNLMWSSSMALNGLIGLGKEQDWSSHNISHALSALYDIPHGASLSIIFPAWMEYVYKKDIPKFKRYAIEVWNVTSDGKTDEEIALLGINKTKEFFEFLGAPTSLKDVNISEEDIDKLVNLVDIDNAGSYIKITEDDVKQILLNCL